MAPLGYHLELLSDHYFILTNEDAVFVHLSDVSHQFLFLYISILGQYLILHTHIPILGQDHIYTHIM